MQKLGKLPGDISCREDAGRDNVPGAPVRYFHILHDYHKFVGTWHSLRWHLAPGTRFVGTIMHSIHINWKQDLEFEAHQQGRTIELISSINHDKSGKAVSPKQLLLTALAGCTGMDIASLLPKMRVPFTSISIRVNGQLSEDHPRVYTHIHIIYEVGAAREFLPKIEKAVELSSTQYCGVSAMLRKAAQITNEIILV